MTGTYFDPHVEPEHQCRPPEVFGTQRGWRCDCGNAFVRETLPDRDVNFGELPYQWKRAPEFDEKP